MFSSISLINAKIKEYKATSYILKKTNINRELAKEIKEEIKKILSSKLSHEEKEILVNKLKKGELSILRNMIGLGLYQDLMIDKKLSRDYVNILFSKPSVFIVDEKFSFDSFIVNNSYNIKTELEFLKGDFGDFGNLEYFYSFDILKASRTIVIPEEINKIKNLIKFSTSEISVVPSTKKAIRDAIHRNFAEKVMKLVRDGIRRNEEEFRLWINDRYSELLGNYTDSNIKAIETYVFSDLHLFTEIKEFQAYNQALPLLDCIRKFELVFLLQSTFIRDIKKYSSIGSIGSITDNVKNMLVINLKEFRINQYKDSKAIKALKNQKNELKNFLESYSQDYYDLIIV